MISKIDKGAQNIKKVSPILIDMQTYFLQIKILAESLDKRGDNYRDIELISKHALATLDYALFALDSLQTEMPLTSVSGAAAVQDVANDLSRFALAYDVELQLDVSKKLEPIYANEAAIKGVIFGLASSLISSRKSGSKKKRIVIAAQETTPTLQRLGVYSPDLDINPRILKIARNIAGQARSAMPSEFHNSGLGILVSDQLALAIGSQLKNFTHRGQRGIGFYIPISTQLSLI